MSSKLVVMVRCFLVSTLQNPDWIAILNVTSLHTYPVKALRGQDHEHFAIKPRGPEGDRRFMVVDDQNVFLTQRDTPDLARIGTRYVDGVLHLVFNGTSVPVKIQSEPQRANVIVWDDVVFAAIAGDEVNAAASDFLGQTVRIAAMDEKSERKADQDFAKPGDPVSFADAFPYLIASETSLHSLNEQIAADGGDGVGMERFRPNIVVDGFPAWDEDSWKVIKVGDVLFDATNPCTRCSVTTTDQINGVRNEDNQPIRTLNRIRRSGDKSVIGPLFAWNLIPRGDGVVNVGDSVEIVERRERWPILSRD